MISRAVESAVRLAIRYRRARDVRWRQVPDLAVSARSTRPPTVYYLAPSPRWPSGGIRNIYRHVDFLNAAGVPAAVVHAKSGARCTWFPNETKVLAAKDVALSPDDLLVVPECYGPGLGGIPGGTRVVMFNQNVYHTFDEVPFDGGEPGSPYADLPGLLALLTVSRDSVDVLRYAFPAVPAHLARLVIDPAVFHPGDALPSRRISYVTHRRPEEQEQLRHLLRARGLLDRWELVPIAGRTETETAAIMRESAIFLSFSDREGFGLPPAEAMASGCYVVGYPGLGGREFFDPRYCAPVPDGDLLAFARAVEEACAAFDDDRETFGKAGQAGAEWIHAQYSADLLLADLLSFYPRLLGR